MELATQSGTLEPSRAAKLKLLPADAAAAARIRRAVGAGKRPRVSIYLTATDSAGNPLITQRYLKLK